MDLKEYKETVLRVINKTDNPVAPFALQNITIGVESFAKCIAPICKHDATDALQKRSLSGFSDEELNGELSKSPEFILALLACLKTSIIGFQSTE